MEAISILHKAIESYNSEIVSLQNRIQRLNQEIQLNQDDIIEYQRIIDDLSAAIKILELTNESNG